MNTRNITIIRLNLIALLLLITSTAIGFSQDATPPKSYVYKQTEQGELSLYVYSPAELKEKQPAIIFFFGGGWTQGKVSQFEPQARHFAERGLIAICADYRVKSRHSVTPDACVEDAKSAIRWVRKNAGMLKVDPDRIVGSGGSAGAHIAACTGIGEGLDLKQEDLTISSRPNALVLYNPVLNLTEPKFKKLLETKEGMAEAISPTLNIKADSPPTLLLFGSNDRLVEQAEQFMARSRQIGHRAEIEIAPDVGHGFFNKAPWLQKTTQRADKFLVSLGYLIPASTETQK